MLHAVGILPINVLTVKINLRNPDYMHIRKTKIKSTEYIYRAILEFASFENNTTSIT